MMRDIMTDEMVQLGHVKIAIISLDIMMAHSKPIAIEPNA